MPTLLILIVVIVYEFAVRFLPTHQNWSLIDFFKRSFDRIIPNYKTEDFPLKKHS